MDSACWKLKKKGDPWPVQSSPLWQARDGHTISCSLPARVRRKARVGAV